MSKVKNHNRFNHKSDIILSLITTATVLCTSHLAFYLFPHNMTLIIWTIVFSMFLSYYRFGTSKHQQIKHICIYSLLTLVILIVAGLADLAPSWYSNIICVLLIFSCLCIHRYLHGGRGIGVILTVFVLLFFSLNPHLTWGSFQVTIFNIAIGISIAYVFKCIFIIILPTDNITVTPASKEIFIIKQAIRITITISLGLIIAHLFALTSPTWICFSNLVICQANFSSSVKKAFERLAGTLLGALIGSILAYILFEAHPLSLYISFILVFFAFYFGKRSYTMAILFSTILITASFYLLKPHLSIHQFITARVVDTLLGITIGLLGEIIIFPQFLTSKNKIK